VIGNATYSHAPPLSNPSNDARDVATKLSGLGFEVVGGEHDGIDLAYGDMAARLRDFGRRLREGSDVETALMFFAGHGLQVDGRNYLVPIDAALEYEADVGSELFELQHILNLMERQRRTSLVLIDACRNNPLARNLARLSGMRQASVAPGLAEQKVVAGTLIAFATQPGHAAYDGEGRNSYFTEALLTHVATPDREIELMLKDVRAKVVSATAQREQGPQVPWVHSSLVGSYYLNPAREAASTQPWPGESQPPQLHPAMSLMHLAAREWAQLQTSIDIAHLGHFAQHFPGYYGDLASSRVAELEHRAAGRAHQSPTSSHVPPRTQEIEKKSQPTPANERPVSALRQFFAGWGRSARVETRVQRPQSLEELERAVAERRAKEQQWRDEGRIEVRVGNGQGDKNIWLKPGETAPCDLDIGPASL